MKKTSQGVVLTGPFVGFCDAEVAGGVLRACQSYMLDRVLPCPDDVLCDLAAQCDGVRWVVLGEAAKDG